MELPDFSNLPLNTLFGYLLLIAAIDVVFNTVLAITRKEFSPVYVLDYLRTHIVMRVFTIGALGIIGHGVPAWDIPAIWPAALAASASLALYVVETVASLREGLTTTRAE